MPKRVIDFDAMWSSDKIASCADWAQTEYAWLYGLADASGCFELTNLRVIWGRVAAVRRNLTIERLEQVFDEFQDKGLLFVWDHEGKRYAHWTGSDVPGRLPPPSWRARLERYAPPVPKQRLAEYMSKFARGRAALAGGRFSAPARGEEEDLKFGISYLKGRGERDFEYANPELKRHEQRDFQCASSDVRGQEQRDFNRANPDLKKREENELNFAGPGFKTQERRTGLKDGVEEAQAQDWNLDWDRNQKGNGDLDSAPWTANAQALNSNTGFNSKADQNPSVEVRTEAKSEEISNWEEGSNARVDAQNQIAGYETPKASAVSNGNSEGSSNVLASPGLWTESGARGERDLDADGNASTRRGGEWGNSSNRAFQAAAAHSTPGGGEGRGFGGASRAALNKWEQTQRDLRVGTGPSSYGPVKLNPEAVERIRRREAALIAARKAQGSG